MERQLQAADNSRMDGKKVSKTGKLHKIVRRTYILGFVSCLIFIALVTLLLWVFGLGRPVIGKDYKAYKSLNDRYGKYNELLTIIDEHALAEYEPEEIDDDVIRDVIEQLDDPYAQYFTKVEYEEYCKYFKDDYVGVGIVIIEYEEKVYVYGVSEDSPADEAGIKAGDILIEVDGNKIETSDEATEAIAGEVGTEVTIKVDRNGKTHKYTMSRAKIENDTVKYKKYDKKNKIAYISINSFADGTAKDLELAIKDLKNDGYKKAIIDLRNNGGGLTKESYNVADLLLPEGVICIEKDKAGKETVRKSKSGDAGIEYVLLVNENTASASELLAGAVQDNEGGKIIGSKTYGKGVTQRTFTLCDKSVVKLTIEEYFTPNRHKVNGKGITPDIEIEDDEEMMKRAVEELK